MAYTDKLLLPEQIPSDWYYMVKLLAQNKNKTSVAIRVGIGTSSLYGRLRVMYKTFGVNSLDKLIREVARYELESGQPNSNRY